MRPDDPFDVGLDLLERAVNRMEDKGVGAPDRRAVVQGTLATWDDCCGGDNGGQLTVRLARLYQSVTFPVEQAGAPRGNCFEAANAARYIVELTACTPGDVTPGGDSPTADAMTASAQETLARATVMYQAMLQWWADMAARMAEAWVGALEPLPEQTGCTGYQIVVVAGLGSYCPDSA